MNLTCILPYEVVLEIFSYLPISSLFACERVCKNWQEFLSKNESNQLWEKAYLINFGKTFDSIKNIKEECHRQWMERMSWRNRKRLHYKLRTYHPIHQFVSSFRFDGNDYFVTLSPNLNHDTFNLNLISVWRMDKQVPNLVTTIKDINNISNIVNAKCIAIKYLPYMETSVSLIHLITGECLYELRNFPEPVKMFFDGNFAFFIQIENSICCWNMSNKHNVFIIPGTRVPHDDIIVECRKVNTDSFLTISKKRNICYWNMKGELLEYYDMIYDSLYLFPFKLDELQSLMAFPNDKNDTVIFNYQKKVCSILPISYSNVNLMNGMFALIDENNSLIIHDIKRNRHGYLKAPLNTRNEIAMYVDESKAVFCFRDYITIIGYKWRDCSTELHFEYKDEIRIHNNMNMKIEGKRMYVQTSLNEFAVYYFY